VRAFVDSWIERKKPEIAPISFAFYREAADKFLAFLGEAAHRDLTEITRDQIARFRNEEAATQLRILLAPGSWRGRE
jgi:hypothetical protein